MKYIYRLRLGVAAFSWFSIGCGESVTATDQPAMTDDFIRANGAALVIGNSATPIFLRGANVQAHWLHNPATGEFMLDDPTDQAIPVIWQDGIFEEQDMASIASYGMNVIRLTLNYRMFEINANACVFSNRATCSYDQRGWDWLDQIIGWARSHDVYVILNQHVLAGGHQSDGLSPELWTERSNQERVILLWSALAQRYRDEAQVAGYDLVNEPVPTPGASQWQAFAQELVDSIRVIDPPSDYLVESINGVAPEAGVPAYWEFPFVPVVDSNVMYDFHMYDPGSYALIRFPPNDEGGVYPDPGVMELTTDFQTGGVTGSLPRTREYMEYVFERWTAFGRDNNAPVNVGEWAVYARACLDRGCYEWMTDVLDLMNQYQLHYQYYPYAVLKLDPIETQSNELTDSQADEIRTRFRELFSSRLP